MTDSTRPRGSRDSLPERHAPRGGAAWPYDNGAWALSMASERSRARGVIEERTVDGGAVTEKMTVSPASALAATALFADKLLTSVERPPGMNITCCTSTPRECQLRPGEISASQHILAPATSRTIANVVSRAACAALHTVCSARTWQGLKHTMMRLPACLQCRMNQVRCTHVADGDGQINAQR